VITSAKDGRATSFGTRITVVVVVRTPQRGAQEPRALRLALGTVEDRELHRHALGEHRVGHDRPVERDRGHEHLGVGRRGLHRDHRAHAVADHHRRAQVERTGQPRHVVRERVDRVRRTEVALAVPAQIERDHAVRRREVLELRRERGVVAAPAVHEHQPRPVARLHVAQRAAVANDLVHRFPLRRRPPAPPRPYRSSPCDIGGARRSFS
jgi:hypothetical protein